MLTTDAIEVFEKAVLCWLATADESGNPSVSPKEIFAVRDTGELLIADIASPRSVRNIRARSSVCVTAIDVFEQRGYQVYGSARVIEGATPDFESVSAPLRGIAGPNFPIRSVIQVRVEEIARVLAPSLWMYPDVPSAERRAGALRSYGVRD